ncbi:MAG: hypothetical protein KGL29_07980 [Alphaproteobacteria bacterium]|nr:hypothetical protein [Alphaproteobacteria bacterium]
MTSRSILTIAAFVFAAASLVTGGALAGCQHYEGGPVTLTGTLSSSYDRALPDSMYSRFGGAVHWTVDEPYQIYLTLDHPICMAAGSDSFNEAARSSLQTLEVIYSHSVTHRGALYTISLPLDRSMIGKHVSVRALLFPGYYGADLHYRTPVVILPTEMRTL